MSVTDKSSIEQWWAQNPMTYASTHGGLAYDDKEYSLGTLEHFQRIDREFYSWNQPLHQDKPFAKIFPYHRHKDSKVLEIGCGLGTMLMNWAQNGSDCYGVDLNPTSIEQTSKRLELLSLTAKISQMDANELKFAGNNFDYAYSWGVLHHSPNLELSLAEMFRVLKPGGEFGIMLYNRQSFYHWYMTCFVEGFLHMEQAFLDDLQLASRYGDGHKEEGNPHTWPITAKEGLNMLQQYSTDAAVKILGTDLDCVFRLMVPGLSKYLPKSLIKALARRFGWSLWFYGRKD